ncbi:methyltransferase domain-containing protein [Streptomyces yaizuensis]|uniref:Protein-L-isoaspartate O-methyltransferase n=1 Tax=Streptomyces yaizuensis TaxID=2989713 RepID=A0ABQ5NQK7_9ACTN|nr:methyltransferase domain-containing protein [Streptomyces sp. YSPA8]GLF92667.1 methyltransferase domain-containing protein [Streptomyces sp. YSPA8]
MTTSIVPADSAEARRRLADTLTAQGALAPGSPWHAAFAETPREVFVPRFTIAGPDGRRDIEPGDPGYLGAVYADTTLTIRRDSAGTPVSSSSQPSLMARMLETFTVPDGARVLEIGTGTGYNTALLCHRFGAGQVTSIDVDPDLTAAARERLAASGHTPLVLAGDGIEGHAGGAPYEGILATCGVDRLPTAWPQQVRSGGLIVTNIGNGVATLTVDEDGSASGSFLLDDAMFMRARPHPGHTAPAANQFTGLIMNSAGNSRTEAARVPIEEVVHATAHEIWMLHHDVLAMTFDPGGHTVFGLVHPPSGSWARITPDGGQVTITHAGPRDLWAERLDLTASWITADRPGPSAYTLTVSSCGAHTIRRTGSSPAVWTL